jgi:hypothetical protein
MCSLRDELKTRSARRFKARMMPMRANIVGPPSVATKIRASIAACHSAAVCSAFGSFVSPAEPDHSPILTCEILAHAMQEILVPQGFLAWGGSKVGDGQLQPIVDTGGPKMARSGEMAMCLKSLTVTEFESQIA